MGRWAVFAVAVALAGCGPKAAGGTGDTDTDGSPEGQPCEAPGSLHGIPDSCGQCVCAEDGTWACSRLSCASHDLTYSVDVLFVVDNTWGTSKAQSRLAAAAGTLTDALDAAKADYRIAVTTTDNGNPWCTATTTPEAGNFVMSSCRARKTEFIEQIDDGTIVFDACTDVCDLETLEVVPTPHPDLPVGARPWLEVIAGVPNVSNATAAQALACMIPQGINGCGFEAPLESMHRAFLRAADESEANFGFGRNRRPLAVVILTDEVDCSHARDTIFELDGDRVYWSDPEAPIPTSAVCWNAGVSCEGGPGTYDSCSAVDKDAHGNEDATIADAVLHPLRRYTDALDDLEDDFQALHYRSDLIVAVIAGVGPDGEVVYADANDPTVQGDFGIGYGCEAPDGVDGLPPVRLREVAERYGAVGFDPPLASVCAEDQIPTMERFVDALIPDMSGCYYGCAADMDRDVAGMQPLCGMQARVPTDNGLETIDVARCTGAGALPGPDVDVCYRLLVNEDLPATCADGGYNVAFDLVRRPGVPLPEGIAWEPACVGSAMLEVDCPGF